MAVEQLNLSDENSINHDDCMDYMKYMGNDCVHLTLTDIPYSAVNRDSNGLRNLNKEDADVMTFDLQEFLTEVYRVTSGTIIIFCGKEQLSEIYAFFDEKQKKKQGTVRHLIWEKTNPSPMNGQYIYLSGIENAVWFKKKGANFNAHCKNPVFKYPCGRSKLHPTEKNHDLLKELILDNSNEGDIVFDPCMGSGSHLLVAKQNNRQWLGVELNREYFNIASERICQ
jgi:DNA modification methylase